MMSAGHKHLSHKKKCHKSTDIVSEIFPTVSLTMTYKSALVQVMAWCNQLSPKPMITKHYMLYQYVPGQISWLQESKFWYLFSLEILWGKKYSKFQHMIQIYQKKKKTSYMIIKEKDQVHTIHTKSNKCIFQPISFCDTLKIYDSVNSIANATEHSLVIIHQNVIWWLIIISKSLLLYTHETQMVEHKYIPMALPKTAVTPVH